MSILFKCKVCGKACAADAPGEACACGCGASLVAPQTSESDCVMVYKDGYPNEGLPITLDELGKQIAAGNFVPLDLILNNGNWQPLNMVFEMSAPASKDNVSSGEEIALKWKELPAAPGFPPPVYAGHGGLRDLASDFWHWFLRARKFHYMSPLQKTVYILVVLAFAAFLYTVLIGKVVNRILWKPAYIAVYNHNDHECTASLFRRKIKIAPRELGVFQDVFVSFPCKANLKLRPANGAKGETKSIKVPVRPGHDLVVNFGGEDVLGEYDLEIMSTLSLSGLLERELGRQIASLQSPDKTLEIQAELHELGKRVLQNSVEGVLLSDENYDFSMMGISRSIDYSEHAKQPAPSSVKLPLVMMNDRVSLKFKNASTDFRARNASMPCAFRVEFPSDFLPLPANRNNARLDKGKVTVKPIAGKAVQANIKYDESKNMVLTLSPLKGNVTAYVRHPIDMHKDFAGTWTYQATLCRSGANANKWKWTWKYDGRVKEKTAPGKAPRQFSMRVERDYAGNTTLKF